MNLGSRYIPDRVRRAKNSSYTCPAEVLQESRGPDQEIYVAVIDVTHVSLPMSVKYSEV